MASHELNQSTTSMSSVFISIVIPHLDQAEYLRSCLESLARQTYDMRRVEIIVVDNGSNAPPTGICSAFDGVRLVEEPTPGPGPARNLGVKVSRGAILAFIDADCAADPGWLAAIDGAFARSSSVAVIGGDVRIARGDPGHATMLEAYESIYAYRQEEYITRQQFSGTGNLAMRRQVHDAVGPFCGIERAEDRDFGQRATRLGFAIAYVPEMIVYHPARRSFEELYAKWERHISHDFREYAATHRGALRWTLYGLAVAMSPAVEIMRLWNSDRVTGAWERWLAFAAVTRIRAWRARRMLAMLCTDGPSVSLGSWTRRS